MNEYTAMRIMNDTTKLMEGFAGQTITLKWIASSTGTWDEFREEYVGGTTTWATKPNVPCYVKSLTAGDVKYGRWGMCSVGDLIIGIDKSEQVTALPTLRIIMDKQEYKVIPNTSIPFSTMSGMVGDDGPLHAIHCRLLGEQQGVVR